MAKVTALSARLMLVAVVSLLAASVAALYWGVCKTWKAIASIVENSGESATIAFHLIQMLDAFLIAIVLYIFAASIHELFVGKLDLPSWIPAHNLTELKTKLSSLVILVMAIEFLGKLLKDTESTILLDTAIAVALVSMTLIVFMRWSDKPGKSADG